MKVWCAVLTAAVALAACGQNANTPQQLETEIQQRGARAVVQQLTAGKGANWIVLCDRFRLAIRNGLKWLVLFGRVPTQATRRAFTTLYRTRY